MLMCTSEERAAAECVTMKCSSGNTAYMPCHKRLLDTLHASCITKHATMHYGMHQK